MKRVAIIASLGAVASATLVANVAAAPASPPRAHLRGFVCHRDVDPLRRQISLDAVMRPVPGTRRMELGFDLLRRTKRNGPWSVVSGGGLPMQTAGGNPPLGQHAADVWSVIDTDKRLPAPAVYRYRVTFRWVLRNHGTAQTKTLYSPKCFQPELRPDLLVDSITVDAVPGKADQAHYTALIRNGGASAAGPFEIEFAPGSASGSPAKSRTVNGLAAGASRAESFVGPACTSASAPTITVDPTDRIDDYNRANNSLTATCPAPDSSSS
jgi:CARDB